jgi:hypothetical protein
MLRTGNRSGRTGDIEILVDHHGLGDQDHLGLAAPGPQHSWPVPGSMA